MACPESWNILWEDMESIHTKQDLCDLQSKVMYSISQDVLFLGSQWKAFPKFECLEDFQNSSFFQKYYVLWEEDISFDRDKNFLQQYGLFDSRKIQNLQRILIALGYLDASVLSGSYCDIHADSMECWSQTWEEADDPLFYFGVFGWKTMEAVKLFQKNNILAPDGIVWPKTREILYQKIFEIFHKK